MTKETRSIILYRLERAHEALQEAEILCVNKGMPILMSTGFIMHVFMRFPRCC